MQMLHFILAAPDCPPSALEMLWLSLQPTKGSVREEERKVPGSQWTRKAPRLAQLPASINGHPHIFFFAGTLLLQESAVPCNSLPGNGFAKHQQEQGHWCTSRKAKPGNCFPKLSRLQPLPRPGGLNLSLFHHCHEAKSCTHPSPYP